LEKKGFLGDIRDHTNFMEWLSRSENENRLDEDKTGERENTTLFDIVRLLE
jgi:hypothetical protein